MTNVPMKTVFENKSDMLVTVAIKPFDMTHRVLLPGDSLSVPKEGYPFGMNEDYVVVLVSARP